MWHWTGGETDWLLIACALLALTSLPLALRLVPPNPYYGFRTRFTLSNRAVWYDANALVGRGLLAGAAVSAAILLWKPFALEEGWDPAIVVVPVMLVVVAGFAYLRHLREALERR